MNREIYSAVANRDGGSLSRMAAPYQDQPKVVNSEAERLVDTLFRQLKQIFPAAGNTNLRTEADENTAKKQWIAAFAEGGIRSKEQLSSGMQYARSSESPFWPSPGQFVSWCRLGAQKQAGLPSCEELVVMFYDYCNRRGYYDSPEAYPWEQYAHYWMVTALYSGMKANNWGDGELRRKAANELSLMAAKIFRGENIPEPKVMIQKLGGKPVTQQQGLEKIAELRAKHGLKRGAF
jgi:hypothetical protein